MRTMLRIEIPGNNFTPEHIRQAVELLMTEEFFSEAKVYNHTCPPQKSDREAYRDAIRKYGSPPAGESSHPLAEGHRDSMG